MAGITTTDIELDNSSKKIVSLRLIKIEGGGEI
jgi:hypothetical protein